MSAIDATGAKRVLVTHGYRDAVVRALRERGLEAESLASGWEGESGENETEIGVEEDVVPDDEQVPE